MALLMFGPPVENNHHVLFAVHFFGRPHEPSNGYRVLGETLSSIFLKILYGFIAYGSRKPYHADPTEAGGIREDLRRSV